jgi:uridylate kinase
LLKATKVDGIYDRDPVRHAEAKMLERVSYDRLLADHLGVMDATAIALCRDNGLRIRVFKMVPGNIRRVCLGDTLGTTVSD